MHLANCRNRTSPINFFDQAYFEAQDVLGRWIEDCCILDKNLQLEPAKLRASFNAWAGENDLEEMASNAFTDAIDHFEAATLKRIKSDGKRWVRGIGLKVQPQQRSRWGDDDGSDAVEPDNGDDR
jgi:phage/plasmid-associated DNA primase